MSGPAATTRKLAGRLDNESPRPLYVSNVTLALMLVLLLFFCFMHNGYKCFRTDHLTQIPLLYQWADGSLFPRDWFMRTNAHLELRKFHLYLLAAGRSAFGLPLGMLVSYCAIMLGTFAAWVAISRRLFMRAGPAIAAIILAIMIRDGEIGSNHVIEDSLIPRMEAYLLAWWSFYFLLRPKQGIGDWLGGLIAGLFMAGAGYFHPAVPAQFGVVLAIWLLVDPERRDRIKSVVFVAATGLPLIGALKSVSGKMLEKTALSSAEQIQLAAYVRHPHHMIPRLWAGGLWLIFLGVLIVFMISWLRRRRTCPGTRALGRIIAIILGVLAIATVFIELIPVRAIVLFQTYRLTVVLYLCMFLVIGRHIMDLVVTGSYAQRMRAMLLVFSPQGWALGLWAAALEGWLYFDRRRNTRNDWILLPGLVLAICIGARLIDHNFSNAWLWAPAVPAAVAFAEKRGWGARPKLVRGVLGCAAAAGALAISAFFWLPLDRWIDDDQSPYRAKAAAYAYKYQFKPIPIVAIERLGAWAAKHTEPNALFIVPPGREPEGFRIWSRRSVWFEIKFFPYRASGFDEWRMRYLASRGIPDMHDPARKADVERALNDKGGETILDDYRALTPARILALARRIEHAKWEGSGPIYFVSPTLYQDPALELIHQDADRQRKKLDRNRNYLYRVHTQ